MNWGSTAETRFGTSGARRYNVKMADARHLSSLAHGGYARARLLPTEDPAELQRLRDGLVRQLQPAAGLEETVVDQLVGAAWRLQRIARGEEALLRWAVDAYVEREPPPGWSAPGQLDPRRVLRRLRNERIGLDCDIEACARLVADVRQLEREHGLEQTQRWCREIPAEMAANDKLAAILRDVPASLGPEPWLRELARCLTKASRSWRRQRKRLDEQLEGLMADIRAVFAAGGATLDPSAPDLEQLRRLRITEVRGVDRLLTVLAKGRALRRSAALPEQPTQARLQALSE